MNIPINLHQLANEAKLAMKCRVRFQLILSLNAGMVWFGTHDFWWVLASFPAAMLMLLIVEEFAWRRWTRS